MTHNATTLALLLQLALATLSCDSSSAHSAELSADDELRITSANVFTQRYANSRMAKWKVRASAAGRDCGVLLVRTAVILEDAMVEAMHYGSGAYDIYDGGVQHFYRERSFRGVVYQDPTRRVWLYGAVTTLEAETLAPCR